MGIGLLKKLNTIMPDNIKVLISPFIRRGLINNDQFIEQYNSLLKCDSLSEEEIRELSISKLKETLIHAYEHTRYYKRVFDMVGFDAYHFDNPEQLSILPLLTKKDIIDNFEDIQADDVTDYYEGITGGSTGTPLKLNFARESIYIERAFVYHFFHKYGYDYRQSKVASFRGTNFNGKNVKANPLYDEIQLNPCNINRETINEYCKEILRFGADYLHGFPSAIYSFCKYAEEENIQLKGRFKAVFCVSENLYDYQKDYIEKVLNCPCTSFYGHTERNAFAEMSADGLYHFNDLYGYHELTDENEIISTGFINRRMPLVRYVVDDTAVISNGGYRITGHRDGFLYGRNGELLSGASLEVHSELINKLICYQLIQKEKGRLIVAYIPNKDFGEQDREPLKQLFQKKVGDSLIVEIDEVDKMILTKASKYKLIIQEVPQ